MNIKINDEVSVEFRHTIPESYKSVFNLLLNRWRNNGDDLAFVAALELALTRFIYCVILTKNGDEQKIYRMNDPLMIYLTVLLPLEERQRLFQTCETYINPPEPQFNN